MRLRHLIVPTLVVATIFWGCPGCQKDENNPATPQHWITVTAPNGGESWQAGTTHNITWSENGIDTVAIQFSTDGGTAWTNIGNIAAHTLAYSWSVANTPSTNCKIKISWMSDPAISDVSDAAFAIAAASSDNASGTARSDDSTTTTITSPGGAMLIIPPYAVPPFGDGSPCTQTFSIERTADAPPTPPAGETLISEQYRFGPEGFTFAAPVEVRIPVSGVRDSTDVILYRTNRLTGQPEQMSTTYDRQNHFVSTQTYDFCCWFGTERPHRSTALGCIHVVNMSHDKWVRVCVDTFRLDFPDQDSASMGDYALGGLWAPIGEIGWASSGNLYIPQGTFNLCVQWHPRGPSHIYWHEMRRDVTIGQAWSYWDQRCLEFQIGEAVGPDSGECNCIPTPSTPAHTGTVQVTLTWYAPSPGSDMDLHVVEPSGEEIYYNHRTSATGGQLDMDNTCGDWSNGISENIFWTTSAPVGDYIVKVRYYPNSCQANNPQSFLVRTVVEGTTRTFSSSASYSNTVEVTRFSFQGAVVNFDPAPPHVVASKNYPPKN